MEIPQDLQEAIEELSAEYSLRDLQEAALDLSGQYRRKESHTSRFMESAAHRVAYLASRMPATCAAISHCLKAFRKIAADIQVRSLLDLGAGPGSVLWMAKEIFPEIEEATLIEQDSELIRLGKKLLSNSQKTAPFDVKWRAGDLSSELDLDCHDLVSLSYVIGELDTDSQKKIIQKAWEKTSKILLIVEPGTPDGFERIMQARDLLISEGAYILAPCPHSKACPMRGTDKWCHFKERLQRGKIHRSLKQASLSYEDENFSYLVVSRQNYPLNEDRVVGHPQKKSGHLRLELCTENGLLQKTVSKRHKELYRLSKKLSWGEGVPRSLSEN